MNSIRKNVDALRKKLGGKAALVCVTKGRTIDEIKEAHKAGIQLFGENRAQEAKNKWTGVDFGELHMIGHLQTNKVKDAVRIFDMIQSVDSLRLFQKITDEAEKIGKQMKVLVQVNIAKDPRKFGVLPDEIFDFFRNANPLLSSPFVRVEGLMTIVEHTPDISSRRPFFKEMKRIFDDLKNLFQEGRIENVEMKYVSMGMSEDFEVAVEEGSNMVRIGRAIFGDI